MDGGFPVCGRCFIRSLTIKNSTWLAVASTQVFVPGHRPLHPDSRLLDSPTPGLLDSSPCAST